MTSQCIPVATSNCTQLDLQHCIVNYKQYVDNYLNVDEYTHFCNKAPDIISCLATTLETCYHPGYISGVTSLLQEAVTSLKAQCPDRGCDEESAILCTYNFLVKVTKIVLSFGGSCELLLREVEAHSQCVMLTVSSCGSQVLSRYSELTARLTVTTEGICNVLPSSIRPPSEVTRNAYPTPTTTRHITSGSYITTTRPWIRPTTSKPSGLTGTSRVSPPAATSTLISTITWPTSTFAPPTESPDCHVDAATRCINELARGIATQTGQDVPDYTEICSSQFQAAADCARSNTKLCSHFVQNRIEVLLEYLKRLLDGACETTTTVTPSECDTKMARSCLVTILTLTYEKDIQAACQYRENATECINMNTKDCTPEEKQSLNEVLTDALKSLEDKCTDYVQCLGDPIIVLVEGGESKKVTFSFKQPPSVICKQTEGCQVMVDFRFTEDTSPRCGDGVPISQVILGNSNENSSDATPRCSREITDDNWQQLQTVTLTAKIDLIRDGDQKRDFEIVLRKTSYGIEMERRTVCVYQLIIMDNDTSAVCKSLNDPHIHTFDKIYYNNHYEGIFKLYQHKDYPYEVQVASQRCFRGGAPTCNCAAYVRAGDTVFVVDKCLRQRRCWGNCVPRLRTALYYPTDVTPGMRIFSSKNGRIFDVVLPHGTRVRINDAETTLINIYVYPSPYDWGRTTGLCGVYDGNKETDVVDASGKFYDVTALDTIKLRMPIAQTRSWRVAPQDYIYNGYRSDFYMAPTFCQCDDAKTRKGTSIQTCGPDSLIETCSMALGVDVTRKLLRKNSPKYGIKGSRTRRWNDEDGLPDFDDQYDPLAVDDSESSGSWNVTSARQYCWDYLQGDPVIQSCLAVPNIDLDVEMQICVDDILASGETTWAPRARESVLEKCAHELRTNPTYTESALGRTLAENVLGRMCPGDCSGHGRCVKGQCQCNPPYTGPDCALTAGGALTDLSLAHGGLCDVTTMDCNRVIIYGDQFSNTDKGACLFIRTKVTDLDKNDDNTHRILKNATLLSHQELSCQLPDIGQSYKVKVTTDGSTFSDPMLFVSYDSNCFSCEMPAESNITCTRKLDSCIADGVCYAAGSRHDTDPCLVCNPEQYKSKLSRKTSFSCLPGGIAIVTVVCIVLVAAIIAICLCIVCRRRRNRTKKDISGDVMYARSEREPSLAGDKAVISL